MSSIKTAIIQSLADVCDHAYQLEEALHPRFIRQTWIDQVSIANSVLTQDTNEVEDRMAQVFAQTIPVEDWANGVVLANESVMMARAQLSGVFKQAQAAITGAPTDEALAQTLHALHPAAKQAATQVGSTDENDEILLVEIDQWYALSLSMIDPTADGVQDEEMPEDVEAQ